MGRPKNSKNRKLSKENLYKLSTETVELAMVEFIQRIKIESLTDKQKIQLKTLYDNFLLIQESK